MVKAKQIMSADVVYVRKDTPICEAGELLLANEITGMPVVDEEMNLVGVISEKDLLGLFYADKEQKNKTVEFFMSQPPVHYRENDSVKTVIDFMLINYFRRVPVTSKKGKLVGIISRPDVLRYILELRNAESPVGQSQQE